MAHPTDERLEELTDRLENGIKDLFASERYAEYLTAMSKFHRYSYGNAMLILMQCPHAMKKRLKQKALPTLFANILALIPLSIHSVMWQDGAMARNCQN